MADDQRSDNRPVLSVLVFVDVEPGTAIEFPRAQTGQIAGRPRRAVVWRNSLPDTGGMSECHPSAQYRFVAPNPERSVVVHVMYYSQPPVVEATSTSVWCDQSKVCVAAN